MKATVRFQKTIKTPISEGCNFFEGEFDPALGILWVRRAGPVSCEGHPQTPLGYFGIHLVSLACILPDPAEAKRKEGTNAPETRQK